MELFIPHELAARFQRNLRGLIGCGDLADRNAVHNQTCAAVHSDVGKGACLACAAVGDGHIDAFAFISLVKRQRATGNLISVEVDVRGVWIGDGAVSKCRTCEQLQRTAHAIPSVERFVRRFVDRFRCPRGSRGQRTDCT